MSIFGTIISADQLEDAAVTTLESWFKTYSREFELQAGLPQDALPLPRSYTITEEVDRDSADQLPAVVVISPGLTGQPRQEGDGSFRATWALAVGIFVSARTRRDTSRLVRQYGAIIRAIMLQKQSLGGFADGTRWTDESYDDTFGFVDRQSISAGQVIFQVEVVDVTSRWAGPVAPTAPDPVTQPGSDWPLADTVVSTVTPKE